MALAAGTRLGPYEIVAPIGAGGMGEVYRARDSRLRRDVAIKVLPEVAALSADRRERFQREAHAIAALSHPNICAIHDIGAADGTDFLVLELIEGQSLAERLKAGPLSLGEALSIARQIADALSFAHRRGIIHRDLKPANVMVTRTGVKVLDFGLARIARAAGNPAAEVTTTALTGALTEQGIVLGTLPYMAPEQIEGRPTDARADVFAFGATLFEMLSGKRAFDATSAPGLIGAILRAETPSLAAVRSDLPPAVDRLIHACLEKDPDARLESMHDISVELGWIAGRDIPEHGSVTAVAASPARHWLPWLVATVLVVAAAVGGDLVGRVGNTVPQSRRMTTFDIDLPNRLPPGAGLALSPDRQWVAVTTYDGIVAMLWVRRLDSPAWRRVQGGAGGAYPFFSPDSKRLVFWNGKKIVRVDLPDGEPIPICDEPSEFRGGAWLEDNTIVFADNEQRGAGLKRVSASGGASSSFTDLQPGDSGARFPQALGGGRILYLALRGTQVGQLRLIDLNAPNLATTVVESSTNGVVVDGNTLIYTRDGVLVSQKFDGRTGRVTGDPERAPSGILVAQRSVGDAQVAAAAGTVVIDNVRPAVSQLVWFDRAGARLSEFGAALTQTSPELSLDGKRLAIVRTMPDETEPGLWIADARTAVLQLRAIGPLLQQPVWSYDGTRVAFTSLRGVGGNANLFAVNTEGTPQVEPLVQGGIRMDPIGWNRDASAFLWSTSNTGGGGGLPVGIYISHGDSDVTHAAMFQAASRVAGARASPDGTRVAWESAQSGRAEIYVSSFPAGGAPMLVSRDGGRQPRWRGDGRELYFISGKQVVVVKIPVDAAAQPGPPVRLFDAPFSIEQGLAYAVGGDASRFLLLVPTAPATYFLRFTLDWR